MLIFFCWDYERMLNSKTDFLNNAQKKRSRKTLPVVGCVKGPSGGTMGRAFPLDGTRVPPSLAVSPSPFLPTSPTASRAIVARHQSGGRPCPGSGSRGRRSPAPYSSTTRRAGLSSSPPPPAPHPPLGAVPNPKPSPSPLVPAFVAWCVKIWDWVCCCCFGCVWRQLWVRELGEAAAAAAGVQVP